MTIDTAARRMTPEDREAERQAENVASLRVDANRVCLNGKQFAYDITTDGAVKLTLSDGRTLALDGSGHHTGSLP